MTKIFVTLVSDEQFKKKDVRDVMKKLDIFNQGSKFTSETKRRWGGWLSDEEVVTGILVGNIQEHGLQKNCILERILIRNFDGTNSLNGVLNTEDWKFTFWEHFSWNDAKESMAARMCDELAFVSDRGLPAMARSKEYTRPQLNGDDWAAPGKPKHMTKADFFAQVVKPRRRNCWNDKEHWHDFYNNFKPYTPEEVTEVEKRGKTKKVVFKKKYVWG